MKYHMTERIRKVVDDAMDIHGGKGICLGPNNWVGRGYQVIPVGITVEGANILTRSLIMFGQGAIRCHPYVLREMLAAKNEDRSGRLDRIRPRACRPCRAHRREQVARLPARTDRLVFCAAPAGAAPEDGPTTRI